MQNPAGFAPTLEIAARFPHCHPPTTARLVQYKIKKGAFLSHTLRLPSGSFFNWKRLQGTANPVPGSPRLRVSSSPQWVWTWVIQAESHADPTQESDRDLC